MTKEELGKHIDGDIIEIPFELSFSGYAEYVKRFIPHKLREMLQEAHSVYKNSEFVVSGDVKTLLTYTPEGIIITDIRRPWIQIKEGGEYKDNPTLNSYRLSEFLHVGVPTPKMFSYLFLSGAGILHIKTTRIITE